MLVLMFHSPEGWTNVIIRHVSRTVGDIVAYSPWHRVSCIIVCNILLIS